MPEMTADGERIVQVINDSPYLALVDPDAYQGFIREDWTSDDLFARFIDQMAHKRLLVWSSTLAFIWRITVRQWASDERGFQEAIGPIVVSRGRLLLTSFDSLSMVAQYADVSLPEPHERDQVTILPNGEYHCRIIQRDDLRYDPDPNRPPWNPIGFALELTPSDQPLPPWDAVAWSSEG
jgi:hypothetical protein